MLLLLQVNNSCQDYNFRHHNKDVQCFKSLIKRTDISFIVMHKGFVEPLCTACNVFEYTTTCMLINSALFFFTLMENVKCFDFPVASIVNWTLVRHDIVGDKKTRHDPPVIRVLYCCVDDVAWHWHEMFTVRAIALWDVSHFNLTVQDRFVPSIRDLVALVLWMAVHVRGFTSINTINVWNFSRIEPNRRKALNSKHPQNRLSTKQNSSLNTY